MPSLPVRVEIREKVGGGYIRFTIPTVNFTAYPAARDIVEFRYDGWAERAEVQYLYHACGNNCGLMVVSAITTLDYDQMLLIFDKFKDSLVITDLEISRATPPASYLLYRIMRRLWGRDYYDHQHDSPQALGGLLRAVLMAAGHDNQRAVEDLHDILIEDGRRNHDKQLSLLRLLAAWDKYTNLAQVAVNVEDSAVLAMVANVFVRIKSVTPEQLPACLRVATL